MSVISPQTEGRKDDTGKVLLDLFPIACLEEIGRVLTFGAQKYAPYNWAKGIVYSRLFAACLRHIFAFWRGEKLDPETNIHHLAHAICCLLFLLYYELKPERYQEPKLDDRVLLD